MFASFAQDNGAALEEALAAIGPSWNAVQAYTAANPAQSAVLAIAAVITSIIGQRLCLLLGLVVFATLLQLLLSVQSEPSQILTLGLALVAMAALSAGLLQHRKALRRSRQAIKQLTLEHAQLNRRLEREILWRKATKQSTVHAIGPG